MSSMKMVSYQHPGCGHLQAQWPDLLAAGKLNPCRQCEVEIPRTILAQTQGHHCVVTGNPSVGICADACEDLLRLSAQVNQLPRNARGEIRDLNARITAIRAYLHLSNGGGMYDFRPQAGRKYFDR